MMYLHNKLREEQWIVALIEIYVFGEGMTKMTKNQGKPRVWTMGEMNVRKPRTHSWWWRQILMKRLIKFFEIKITD